jgi:hypothetical protein
MPLVTEERYWALFYMPLYTFIHSLLNVLVQIANKMGLQKILPLDTSERGKITHKQFSRELS